VPDDGRLRIMLDEGEIRACVAEHGANFAELWWGSRLSCVVVDLQVVDPGSSPSWSPTPAGRKAPRTLIRAHDAAP